MSLLRWVGRAIGLDVRSAGRVKSTPEAIQVLVSSLLATDRVALEVTGSAWEVARILEPFVNKVIVVSPDDTGIAQARAKTDRLDARALAKLLVCCGPASSRRSGCRTRAAGGCVDGWLAASNSSARGPGRRTRSTRC
jgi:hypothetical protein